MTAWIVGDIHGCAAELELLFEELAPGPSDQLVCVGDLFHRGPDAAGVLDLLRGQGARFVLGNHEEAVLRRVGLAPSVADGSDRPELRTSFPPLHADDLVGDGRRPLVAPEGRLGDILCFLQEHDGYYLEHTGLECGPTPDGRGWCVVHAGVTPGEEPARSRPRDLMYPRRLGRGRPLWFEAYEGPGLILYGHMPAREPRETRVDGRLVALGLDTGCVYGGRLTAYAPELDELRSVPAARAYAEI